VTRNILISFALVIVATVLCAGACRAAGADPHLSDLGLAAGICLLAAIAGLIPISFAGRSSLTALFQAALIGSVLHMAAAIGLAAAAVLCLRRGNVFVYWMLAFYWVTLLEILAIFVGRSRTQQRSASASI
jgi:hypothetical protein